MLDVRPPDLIRHLHPALASSLTALRVVGVRPPTDDIDVEGLDGFVPPSRASRAIKRSIDLLVVTLAMPVLLPVMLLIALLVKATSRGPVLFRHVRVGRDGQLFKVLKFRTMRPGTHESIWTDLDKVEEFAARGFKLPDRDPAITKFGRFLRRTSLDELPQFFNVLGGTMSLVGVRPLVVPEVTMRPELDQALYTLMKPGITGLWQTNGRTAADIETRWELDRRYILEWSLFGDIGILLRTPFAVLRIQHAA